MLRMEVTRKEHKKELGNFGELHRQVPRYSPMFLDTKF